MVTSPEKIEKGRTNVGRGGGVRETDEEDDEEIAEMGSVVRDAIDEGDKAKAEKMADESVLYVKVMTDEQMEVLRRQISVYATICEQLVEMHKAVTAQQDSLSGMRLGNMYCDPLMTVSGHKITARQRWTPTPVQLQILESIFDQGNGTPSKQKIKEITSELTQHGQISETNVYNWFQNRRARSKRKQQVSIPNNNSADSEVDTEVDSPKEKKAKAENNQTVENQAPRAEDLCFQSQEISSDLHSLDSQSGKAQGPYLANGSVKSSGTMDHILFYENVLSDPRMDHHLMGKMGISGGFSHFRSGGSYDMIG